MRLPKLHLKFKKKNFRKSYINRNFANNPPNGIGSVIDGRDITSVIAPKAKLNFI